MKIRFFLFYFPIFLCLILSCKKENGCYVEKGSTETRIVDLPSFHTINHSIKASFQLSSGPVQQVKITGNKNILNVLEKESSVENGIWNLGFKSCIDNYEPLVIDLTLPNYVGFTNNGLGDVSGQNQLNTASEFSVEVGGTGDLDLTINSIETLNIYLKGTGNIKLSGSANFENILITGTGIVDCFGLVANVTDVDIQGNGNCFVTVNDSLNVEIIGNGTVYYKGYPQIVQSITGAGSIVDAN